MRIYSQFLKNTTLDETIKQIGNIYDKQTDTTGNIYGRNEMSEPA